MYTTVSFSPKKNNKGKTLSACINSNTHTL